MEEKEIKDFDHKWECLQIKNDYIFSKVMRDKEICIALLERLLKLKIKDIVYLEEKSQSILNMRQKAYALMCM